MTPSNDNALPGRLDPLPDRLDPLPGRLEDLPPVLVPAEVARAMRLHVETVRELIRLGRLRATNVAKGRKPSYRINRADVISFLNGDTEQGRAPVGVARAAAVAIASEALSARGRAA